MAWIDQIDESAAEEGVLREAYARAGDERGRISNVLKVQSLHPVSLRAHLDLELAVMFERKTLSRERCELIAVAVSAANRCPYCVRLHTEALNTTWRDINRTVSYALDTAGYPLPVTERAMVDYALKLTRTPDQMTEADTESLRRVDFNDVQILLIAQVAGFVNYVNRLVLGLGVKVETDTEGFRH